MVWITVVLFAFLVNNSESVYATEQTISFSLPLKFKWGHGGLVRGRKYKVKLKALQENAPMPEKSQHEEYIKSVSEDEIKELFPEIKYTGTGDYEYEIALIRGRYKVLKKYYLHIQVLNRGNGELFLTTAIHKNTESGVKVTEIRFMDLGDDENLYDKDYNRSDHHRSSERDDEYLKQKNKTNSELQNKTSKNSTAKSRTGDDKKVEMYLWMSIVSLGVLLVIQYGISTSKMLK